MSCLDSSAELAPEPRFPDPRETWSCFYGSSYKQVLVLCLYGAEFVFAMIHRIWKEGQREAWPRSLILASVSRASLPLSLWDTSTWALHGPPPPYSSVTSPLLCLALRCQDHLRRRMTGRKGKPLLVSGVSRGFRERKLEGAPNPPHIS